MDGLSCGAVNRVLLPTLGFLLGYSMTMFVLSAESSRISICTCEVQDTHELEKLICGSSKLTEHKDSTDF